MCYILITWLKKKDKKTNKQKSVVHMLKKAKKTKQISTIYSADVLDTVLETNILDKLQQLELETLPV